MVMTNKIRTKLLTLYKEYYRYSRVVDDDDEIVVAFGVPITVPTAKVDYTGGLINAIKELISTSDPLYNIFGNYNKDMTFEYYFNWSGQKWIAPVYEELLEHFDNDLYEVDKQLAKIIVNRFKANWESRYLAYTAEYNPLHNYDMEETSRTNMDVSEDMSSTNNVFGYNSSEAVPSESANGGKRTHGTKNDNYTELERKGNIGVTTSQKMLTDELEVRRYDFIQSIYKDIDTVVVLSVY